MTLSVIFSSQPARLVFVLVLAIVGGLIVFALDRLSQSSRTYVKLVTLAAAACAVTAYVIWMGFSLAFTPNPINPRFTESIGNHWAFVALSVFAATAAYLWLRFYQTLRYNSRRQNVGDVKP
jgi:hypothetical protein